MLWRGLEGRFSGGRCYALPGNVPQRAIWAEVRWKAGGEMRPGGAWEAGSATERALTASQSQGHGERFGWEKGVVSHEMEHRAHLRAGGAKAWEAGSAAGGVTHFREMCHRGPFGWKCVEWREKRGGLREMRRDKRECCAVRVAPGRRRCPTAACADGDVGIFWKKK